MRGMVFDGEGRNDRYHVGDFNGDGKDDILHFASGKQMRMWEGNTNNSFTVQNVGLPVDAYENIRYTYGRLDGSGYLMFHTGDFDKDGKTDMMHLFQNAGYAEMWYSYGDHQGERRFASHPGGPGGRSHEVRDMSGAMSKVMENEGWATNLKGEYIYISGDFDGDQLTDFLHIKGEIESEVFFSRPGGISYFESKSDDAGIVVGPSYHDFSQSYKTGDFNGDNKTDIMVVSVLGDKWQLYLSNGNGKFTLHHATIPTHAKKHLYETGNFNGDNRDNFIYFGADNSIQVYELIGEGSTARFEVATSDAPATMKDYDNRPQEGKGKTKNIIGDFNGDGKDDIFHIIDANRYQLFTAN